VHPRFPLALASIAVPTAVVLLAVATRAQQQAASGDGSTCIPACRAGFVCVKGQCVSACNPPCAPGQTCTPAGECVLPVASSSGAPSSSASAPPSTTPSATSSPPPQGGSWGNLGQPGDEPSWVKAAREQRAKDDSARREKETADREKQAAVERQADAFDAARASRFLVSPYVGVGYVSAFGRTMGLGSGIPQTISVNAQPLELEAGLGLRKPVGHAWELQARALFVFIPSDVGENRVTDPTCAPAGASSCVLSATAQPLIGGALDATARIHLLPSGDASALGYSPLYVGFGLRVNALYYSAHGDWTKTSGTSKPTASADESTVVPFLLGVLEVGATLGPREQWDVGLRAAFNDSGGQVVAAVGYGF
jgi:hypothetical protein